MAKQNNFLKPLSLGIMILIVILYHVYAYIGHNGYEDIHYAKLAANFLEGTIDYSDHYAFRWTIILFTALSYSILGINDLASSLPAMVVFIGGLLLVYNILKYERPAVLFIGLALAGLSHFSLFYSDKIMPDVYITFAYLLAIHTYFRLKFRAGKKNEFIFALVFTSSLWFGFLAKGTIVLILPWILYILIRDILRKENIRFWSYTTTIGFSILGSFYFIMEHLSGNVLLHFKEISESSYLNLCSYEDQPTIFLIKRIAFELLFKLIESGILLGFAFTIPFIFRSKGWEIWKMSNKKEYFIMTAVLLLFSANFMTISFSSYVPMCVDPTHYLYLIPVFGIAGAYSIKEFIENRLMMKRFVVLFIGLSALTILRSSSAMYEIYIPITVLLLLYILMPVSKLGNTVFLTILAASLLIKPASILRYANNVSYNYQKEILEKEVLGSDEVYIVSDEVQINLLEYYYEFNVPKNVELIKYTKADSLTYSNDKKGILINNRHTRFLSKSNEQKMPLFALNLDSGSLIFNDSRIDLSIFELDSIPDTKILLSTNNDFSQDLDHWTYHPADTDTIKRYGGNPCMRINEESAVFSLKTQNIIKKDSLTESHLLIKLDANLSGKQEVNLAYKLSLQDSLHQDNIIPMGKFIPAYNSWWPLQYQTTIDRAFLQQNGTIQIYISSPGQEDLYIDNFEIIIFEQ